MVNNVEGHRIEDKSKEDEDLFGPFVNSLMLTKEIMIVTPLDGISDKTLKQGFEQGL